MAIPSHWLFFCCPFPVDLGTSGTICWPILQGEQEKEVPALRFEFALNVGVLQRARRLALQLAASALTSKWSFGFGMRTSQLVLHHWLWKGHLHWSEVGHLRACSGWGMPSWGLGLKHSQSFSPKPIFAARPAAIRWQQPASPPNLDTLQELLATTAPLCSPQSLSQPAVLLLQLMQPHAPVAEQFPWPHHWSATAPVGL